VGRYFESFEEAWANFLAREEPLESFYDEFTGGAFEGDVYLIEPAPEVKRAALRVQAALEPFDFLTVVPHHFLHVAITEDAVARLGGREKPLELDYPRVSCFHTAVVAEVWVRALRPLDPTPTFLPHLTLAVVTRPAPPDELRTALIPLRDTELGTQRVNEVLRVHVQVSPERGLEPWNVLERIPL
jgi:hypothetical protein